MCLLVVKREFITEPSSLSTCKELGHQRRHALEHPTAPPPVLAASPHVIVLTEGASHVTPQCCDWGLWNLGHAELSLLTSPKESSSTVSRSEPAFFHLVPENV